MMTGCDDKKILLLDFKNVTVIRGEKKILDSVSVSIGQGENVAILGPNGAGKSSFIKAITREYYPLPRTGDFCFKILGAERWNIFALRSMLGIVFADLQTTFTRGLSGMEMVLSGFFSSVGLYKEHVTPRMRKKAREILAFLEIEHLTDRKINEMSTGEVRRFLIGRALVHDPRALVLDEPSNSLDLHALDKFNSIVRKIARSGIGIILVTHTLQDIIPEITRVILMKEGRFYKDGPKDKVLTSKNIRGLFSVKVEIERKCGYYYALKN